jgi:pimeloyl-ACP methyl ester carboxylesterase
MATFVDRSLRRILSRLGLHSRFVATTIARHHVYDTGGTGAPIVCLPGLSDTAASWVPVVLSLGKHGYRVLVVESAGHGLSEQPSCEYTVDTHFRSTTEALDLVLAHVDGPVLLVGNSLGGATALHYAVRRPAAIRGLFLTSPGGGLADETVVSELRALFTTRSVRDARVFLGRVLHRATVFHAPLAFAVRAGHASRAVVDLVASLRTDQDVEGIGSITAPIHVVWGQSERLLPSTSLAWYRTQLPRHATVVEPTGFGHCPHLDNPFRLATMIDAYIKAGLVPDATPVAAAG